MSLGDDILHRTRLLPRRRPAVSLRGRRQRELAAAQPAPVRVERPVFFTDSRFREYAFRAICLAIFAFAVTSLTVIIARTLFPPDLSISYTNVFERLDAEDHATARRSEPTSPIPVVPAKADTDPQDKPAGPTPEAGEIEKIPAAFLDRPLKILSAGLSIDSISGAATKWIDSILPNETAPTTKVFVSLDDIDKSAAYSLGRNQANIDYLLPAWLHVNALGGIALDPSDDRAALGDALGPRRWPVTEASRRPTIVPILDNLGSDDVEMTGTRRLLAGDFATKQHFIQDLLGTLKQIGAEGVAIDFDGLEPGDVAQLGRILASLAPQLRAQNMLLVVRAPLADKSGVWKVAATPADYVILKDKDYAAGTLDIVPEDRTAAVSAALQGWVKSRRAEALAVEIPGPSYQITNGGRNGRMLSFDDVIETLARGGLTRIFHPGASLGNVKFADSEGLQRIFVQDAITFFNFHRLMEKLGVANVSFRNLGGEDPSTWTLLDRLRRGGQVSADMLTGLGYTYPFEVAGGGEVFSVSGEQKDGRRELSIASDGTIYGEAFASQPERRTLHRWGDKFPNKLALTFDDGPDPRFTPKILDVLKRYNVPAAFFVVGSNVLREPSLLRRMLDEGHEIGNHTFSHPDLSRISDMQMDVELSGTQRVLESTIGHDTLLFRAPYASDDLGSSYGELEVAIKASALGYIMVDMLIDPNDWQISNGDLIADRVIRAAESNAGHVILLHDAGGDRSGTIAALPKIITELRARGYEFASIADLVGLSGDAFMPVVQGNPNPLLIQSTGISFLGTVVVWAGRLLFLAIVLGIGRVAIIMLLAGLPRRRRPLVDIALPTVSVLVPAFNEEKVVVETVNSIRRSNYPNLEIVVIDDGSTDSTLETLRRAFEGTEVRLLTKRNGGKASALNLGIKSTTGEFIIALDADTLYRPDTISALIRHFADPSIGAVAGNAKVGNRTNILTRLQALEYITAQNLDRRAFEIIGGITVVPGAVGAWRRSAVEQAGLYSSETVAEDADLTISLLRKGWKVVYAPDAVAFTEAPETLRALVRQRYRWAFGTLQNMWKHRQAFLQPRRSGLCFIAFPHMAIFQFALPVLAPIADVMFVAGILGLAVHKWFHPGLPISADALLLLESYLVFSFVDGAAAVAGFIAERREDARLLFLIPLQRVMYRQILYVVLVKAIAGAIKGQLARWDKLERTATVSAS